MEPKQRPPPALVSELLEEIFVRVASPADLARAAAACVSFRRLIGDPSFIRRYRSVHPPLFLGLLKNDGLHPVEAGHPAAAVARAVARTADFSFSFLPGQCRWHPSQVHDGRVLVERREKLAMGTEHRLSWDIAVCDPLARRYLLLPPMSDDLLASVGLRNQDMFNSGAFMVTSGGMEEDETSPSVMCWMISKTRLAVFVFSASSGHWAVGTSISWADLGLYEEERVGVNAISDQCVYGCFYWQVDYQNKLLKLDMNTMVLSTYDLPPDHDHRSMIVAEAGEGKVAMFSALNEGTTMEYYTFMQNGTDKSCKWHLESTIPFPVHGTGEFFIFAHAEGYVFLTHTINEEDPRYLEFFTRDVKSCNLERASRTGPSVFGHPYFGFPPSMSPRRIQGCGELQD